MSIEAFKSDMGNTDIVRSQNCPEEPKMRFKGVERHLMLIAFCFDEMCRCATHMAEANQLEAKLGVSTLPHDRAGARDLLTLLKLEGEVFGGRDVA